MGDQWSNDGPPKVSFTPPPRPQRPSDDGAPDEPLLSHGWSTQGRSRASRMKSAGLVAALIVAALVGTWILASWMLDLGREAGESRRDDTAAGAAPTSSATSTPSPSDPTPAPTTTPAPAPSTSIKPPSPSKSSTSSSPTSTKSQVQWPPTGAQDCGSRGSGTPSKAAAGAKTSCPFALEVLANYKAGQVFSARSPVTGEAYSMKCTGSALITCKVRGPSEAVVYLN